jgi:hypothetical protein
MLVVGAWVGRAGGLVVLGVVTAIALAGTSVTEPAYHGTRDRSFTPTTADRVLRHYHVPAGSITLDLSNIRDVQRLDGRTIDDDANAGQLVVILPRGVDADVDADVSVAGRAEVAGRAVDGTGVHLQRVVDGGTDVPAIGLNLDLVFGNIEVRQS